MRSLERVSVVASLPPHGSWRRALAVERAGGEPRAVILSYAPADVVDDPARLAALVRDVEAAGRLHHPCAVQVLGTDATGDALAIVEAFRPGETLRALLDAAGRLPPEIGARVVADACAAVASAHAIDAGEGHALVHGAISPERIAVGHDGAALVYGFGAGGGGVPAADVRALAAVLHECLSGEQFGGDASSLALPGIPPAIAEVVSRALRGEVPSAEELGRAVAGALPLAAHAEVMAYSEAVLPAARGERAGLGDEEYAPLAAGAEAPGDVTALAEDHVRRGPGPEPFPTPSPSAADAARVFAAPSPPPAPRSRLPLVVTICALVGFAAGFVVARAGAGAAPPPPSGPIEAAAEAPSPYAEVEPKAAPEAPLAVPPPAPERAPAVAERGPDRAPERVAPPRRAPAPKSGAAPRKAAAAPAAEGVLAVTAPDEAEVFLDGRALGRGSLRRDVPAGAHLIEVRLGDARVAEAFEIAPGETWTYEVTPTP